MGIAAEQACYVMSLTDSAIVVRSWSGVAILDALYTGLRVPLRSGEEAGHCAVQCNRLICSDGLPDSKGWCHAFGVSQWQFGLF